MVERLGRYELIGRIAVGGMAEVFLARLEGVHGFARPVVIKRMLPQLSVDAECVRMFLDEARLCSHITHGNVVQVLDLGEASGAYFIAMEFIDGPNLADLSSRLIARGQPLAAELAVYCVARAADGLHAAHESRDPTTGKPQQLVHRDISPQNILVSRTGEPKVADFGVAKSDAQSARTRSGVVKGKLAYMSPEQVQAEPLDRRSDVFALGAVLWELLCRRRLHHGKNDLQLMQQIVQQEPQPPSQINPDVDGRLDAIVLKALKKSAADRWPSALAMGEALDAWRDSKRAPDGKKQLERLVQSLEETSSSHPDPSADSYVGQLLKRAKGQLEPVQTPASGEVVSTVPAVSRPTIRTPSLPRTSSDPGSSVATAIVPRQKKQALVVDDNAENREILTRALERRGFSVDSLSSGFGVVNKVAGREGNVRPDVVILDYMMAGLSGAAVLGMLASDATCKDVPVLLFSAADKAKLDALAKTHPACTPIQKGGGVAMLMDAIDRVMKRPV